MGHTVWPLSRGSAHRRTRCGPCQKGRGRVPQGWAHVPLFTRAPGPERGSGLLSLPSSKPSGMCPTHEIESSRTSTRLRWTHKPYPSVRTAPRVSGFRAWRLRPGTLRLRPLSFPLPRSPEAPPLSGTSRPPEELPSFLHFPTPPTQVLNFRGFRASLGGAVTLKAQPCQPRLLPISLRISERSIFLSL